MDYSMVKGVARNLEPRVCKCGCGESYTPRQVNQKFKDVDHKKRFWTQVRLEPLRAYWAKQKRKQRAK